MSRDPSTSALVSSKSNPTIKRIRALRHRKEREQTGSFFVEGIRLVGEAVELGAEVELCVVAPDLLTSRFGQDLVRRLTDEGIRCLAVTVEVFRSISGKQGPQGIGAVVKQRWETLEQVELSTELCWVAIEAVQDPGNLGTILRTSDAVGGAGVILLGPATDPHDPAALRAGMGAIFSQQLVRASFEQFTDWKRKHGYLLVGTSNAADLDYRAVGYYPPLVLLMGSEREGLGPERQALCDLVVSIPMVGRSDSLNLAVAAGVMLYEIFNQQRARAIRRR